MMSVATFPYRFSEMYKLLLNKGWALVEKVEDTADGKVMLMKDVNMRTVLEVLLEWARAICYWRTFGDCEYSAECH